MFKYRLKRGAGHKKTAILFKVSRGTVSMTAFADQNSAPAIMNHGCSPKLPNSDDNILIM